MRAHAQCAAAIVIGRYDICQVLYIDASSATRSISVIDTFVRL